MSESRTYEEGQQNDRDECLQFLRNQDLTAFRTLQQWLAGRGHQIQIDFTKVLQQPTKIKDFPSEILVNIFDRLSAEEKVRARRVWREWSSTINNHSKLWRRLVVRKWIWSGGREWDQSILELFDQRSKSTLEEVDLQGFIIQDAEMTPLMQLIEKSKTLKTFRIHFEPQTHYGGETEDLSSSWTKFPSITDYRVIDQTINVSPIAVLVQKNHHKCQAEEPEKLQVLWGWFWDYQLLPNIQLLSNLKSFYCHITIDLVTLRKVLDEPSKTLVHLRLAIESDFLGDRPS